MSGRAVKGLRWLAYLSLCVAAVALMAGCNTGRVYEPAPHYTGYGLEAAE